MGTLLGRSLLGCLLLGRLLLEHRCWGVHCWGIGVLAGKPAQRAGVPASMYIQPQLFSIKPWTEKGLLVLNKLECTNSVKTKIC